MATTYETMVLVDAMIADESVQSEFDVLENLIKSHGKLIKKDIWGRCKLAYSIKKRNYATYGVFYYESNGELVNIIEKGFAINDNIIRWITVANNPIPTFETKQENSEAKKEDSITDNSEVSKETVIEDEGK